jgi:hypothetical protein
MRALGDRIVAVIGLMLLARPGYGTNGKVHHADVRCNGRKSVGVLIGFFRSTLDKALVA